MQIASEGVSSIRLIMESVRYVMLHVLFNQEMYLVDQGILLHYRIKVNMEGVQLENVFAKLGLIKCSSVHLNEIALSLLPRDETVCVHI